MSCNRSCSGGAVGKVTSASLIYDTITTAYVRRPIPARPSVLIRRDPGPEERPTESRAGWVVAEPCSRSIAVSVARCLSRVRRLLYPAFAPSGDLGGKAT